MTAEEPSVTPSMQRYKDSVIREASDNDLTSQMKLEIKIGSKVQNKSMHEEAAVERIAISQSYK